MSTTTRPASAHRFFSRHGTLSKWHPNYEFRQGQLEMAEAVESALKDRKHLIVEAGTGTGKTLAYLVPAILSGRRIVVSTRPPIPTRVTTVGGHALVDAGLRAQQPHVALCPEPKLPLVRQFGLKRWM